MKLVSVGVALSACITTMSVGELWIVMSSIGLSDASNPRIAILSGSSSIMACPIA